MGGGENPCTTTASGQHWVTAFCAACQRTEVTPVLYFKVLVYF